MASERVQKIIAQAGLASRRKAEEMISEGLVTINGKVANLGDKADLSQDAIKVKGKLLRSTEAPMYVALYKPRGVISMMADPDGRPTLADYLSAFHVRLFPVGRLDFNSEGLIFLTNDGAIAEQIQKRDDIPRVYHVKVKGHPEPEKIERLAKGGKLEGGFVKPHSVRLAQRLANKALIEVVILGSGGGDLKALFESKGLLVEKIVRISVGHLNIHGIGPGEHKLLKKSQLEAVISQPELAMKAIEDGAERARPAEAARVARVERDAAFQDRKEKTTAFKVRIATEARAPREERGGWNSDPRGPRVSSERPRRGPAAGGPRPVFGRKRDAAEAGGDSPRPIRPRSSEDSRGTGPSSGGFAEKRGAWGSDAPRAPRESRGGFGTRRDGASSFGEKRGGFGKPAGFARGGEGRTGGFGKRPMGEKRSGGFADKRSGGFGDRPSPGGFGGDRPRGPRSDGPRSSGGFGDKRSVGGFGGDRPRGPRSDGPRSSGGFGDKRSSGGFGDKRSSGGFGGDRPRGPRSDGPRSSGGFGDKRSSGGFGDKRSSGGFGDKRSAGGFGGDRPRGPRSDGPRSAGGFGDKRSSGGFGDKRSTGGFGDKRSSGGFGSKKPESRGPSSEDKSGPTPAGGARIRRKNVY